MGRLVLQDLPPDARRPGHATSDAAPTVAADDFRGLFTLATCILMPVETRQTCRFELRGDGSKASVLALNDQFWVQAPGTTSDTVWQNKATPPAHGGLIGCNINTSNKDAAPKGFEFLPNVGDDPDPAKSNRGSGPLADRGGVDDATLLRHLAPLRESRVWLPGQAAAPAGATDLRIHRVMASGGTGATIEFRAKPVRDDPCALWEAPVRRPRTVPAAPAPFPAILPPWPGQPRSKWH